MASSFSLSDLAAAIKRSLTPELLKPRYRKATRPFAGHCYVASEAFFHLAGGRKAGFRPKFIRHENEPHWWIEGPGGTVWDLTKEQFITPVPYARSVPKGFLTSKPSKRARVIISRVQRRAIIKEKTA